MGFFMDYFGPPSRTGLTRFQRSSSGTGATALGKSPGKSPLEPLIAILHALCIRDVILCRWKSVRWRRQKSMTMCRPPWRGAGRRRPVRGSEDPSRRRRSSRAAGRRRTCIPRDRTSYEERVAATRNAPTNSTSRNHSSPQKTCIFTRNNENDTIISAPENARLLLGVKGDARLLNEGRRTLAA